MTVMATARSSGPAASTATPGDRSDRTDMREVPLPEHLRGRAPVPPAPPTDQEVLAARDLAGLLMVPTTTIYRLWRQTDIPGRMVGKELRFVRADVIAWISAGHPTTGAIADDALPEETSDDLA